MKRLLAIEHFYKAPQLNIFEVIIIGGAALRGMAIGSHFAGVAGTLAGLAAGPALIFTISWAFSKRKR